MKTKILYGKAVADSVKNSLVNRIENCKREGVLPGLVVVLVGKDPASKSYVKSKGRACETLGIYSETIHLPAETTQDELNTLVDSLNNDDRFHGILVQIMTHHQTIFSGEKMKGD